MVKASIEIHFAANKAQKGGDQFGIGGCDFNIFPLLIYAPNPY
jgi:hypothetical protein